MGRETRCPAARLVPPRPSAARHRSSDIVMPAGPFVMPSRDCRIIELPRVQDARGNLTFIESRRHVPFPFERIYWIYDIPGGEERGGHAYRTAHEFLIALSGSFDVVL